MGRGARQQMTATALDALLGDESAERPRWAVDISHERWQRDRPGYWRDWLWSLAQMEQVRFYDDDGEQAITAISGRELERGLRAMALGVSEVSLGPEEKSLTALREAEHISLSLPRASSSSHTALIDARTALADYRMSAMMPLNAEIALEGDKRLRLSNGPPLPREVALYNRFDEQFMIGPWSPWAVAAMLQVVGPRATLATVSSGEESLTVIYRLERNRSPGKEYLLSYMQLLSSGAQHTKDNWFINAKQVEQLPRICD